MSRNGLPKDMSVAAIVERHDKHVVRAEADESYQSAEAKAKAENDEKTLQWLHDNRRLWH